MLSRYSLRTLLLTGAFLIAIIPLAVLWFGSARAIRSLSFTDRMENTEMLAQGLADDLEQFLALHLQAMVATAGNLGRVQPFTDQNLAPLLKQTRASFPAFLTCTVIDGSGKSVAYDPPTGADGKSNIGIDFSDRAWFPEAMRTKRPLIDRSVVLGKTTKRFVVVLAAPVHDAQGRFLGVAAAGLDLTRLDAIAARIHVGKTGYAVVATAQGAPLAHGNAALVQEQRDFSKLPVWPLVTAKEAGPLPTYQGPDGDDRIGGFATVPGVGWKVWVTQARAEVEGDIARAYRPVVVWALVALLGALGVALLVTRAIVQPIRGVQGTATAIAGGDLTQQAPEQGPAEVVSLARAFNQMASTLRQLLTTEREGKARLEQTVAEYGTLAARVGRGDLAARAAVEGEDALAQLGRNLNQLIEALGTLVEQIRRAAEEIAAATVEILAATTQQAAGVAEEVTAVQQTVTTVDEVKQTTQLVTQKAQAVAEAAQRTTQVAQDGRRAVEESTRAAQEAKARMEAIAERILALSEQAQAIGEITATVGDLAEQSNLLAVNAAIEAAKAGEAGKGFAVVAAEVKSLAEQSKQATAQVRGILGEVQRATQAAVMAAEQGVKVSEAGAGVAIRAGEAIRLLAENVGESAQAAQQIVASAQQQVGGMDQVALAMHNIQQASTQTMASTRQVERAAKDLNELARRLQARVSKTPGDPPVGR
jgi:methyl-accepting chemotaxis protein